MKRKHLPHRTPPLRGSRRQETPRSRRQTMNAENERIGKTAQIPASLPGIRKELRRILCPSVILLSLAFPLAAPASADPTLARLSFWLPPERMAAFEGSYREQVLPVLKRHGLAESPVEGRATPDSVFSRLFALANPSEVIQKRNALNADPSWQALLHTPGETCGPGDGADPTPHRFELYTTPAGPGRTRPAGSGKGHWRTYSDADGMAGGNTYAILQDRDGYLWFAHWGSGVTRYDGQAFEVFTTEDGLASNNVQAVFQDRDGYLWFGTRDAGVSRYDGETWTTLNTDNSGLVDDNIRMILQDPQGNLWFAGRHQGVGRYDGETWAIFNTENSGLANDQVVCMYQDREENLWFGTWGGGASCYDGETWTTFNTANSGLVHNTTMSGSPGRKPLPGRPALGMCLFHQVVCAWRSAP